MAGGAGREFFLPEPHLASPSQGVALLDPQGGITSLIVGDVLVKVPAAGVLLGSVVLRFYVAEERYKPLAMEKFEIAIAAQLNASGAGG